MHPHHYMALITELRLPEYASLTKEEAYLYISNAGRLARGLCTTQFLTQEQYDKLPEKKRPQRVIIIDIELSAQFPTGIPGFPNKLKSEWFDSAWNEVRN